MKLHLIHRFKQQPRLGGTPPKTTFIDKTSANIKDLQQSIQTAAQSLEDFHLVIDNIAEIYDKFNNTTLSLGLGINKLAGFQDKVNAKIVQGVKDSTFLEQRNASLAKTLGIHGRKAFELGKQYDDLNTFLKIGGEEIRKFGINLNKIAPGYAKAIVGGGNFGKNLLMTQRILTKNIGLSEDAANKYELYATGVGADSTAMIDYQRKLAEQIEKNTGLTNQFASIVTDIAALSEDIQMQFGKTPGSLELAVLKAKQLGMTFDKIDAAATSAFNIEQSIGQEIEYQLLSGKRLVDADGKSLTNKLRIAKAMGNANDMAQATAEIFETQQSTLEGNNFLAQEQLAALMGMSRQELMRAYQQQKLQKKIQAAATAAGTKIDVDALMKMDESQIAETLKTTGMSQAEMEKLLRDIKDNTSPQTTDQMLAELLDMARTDGIKIQGGSIDFDTMRTAGLDLEKATTKLTAFARDSNFAGVYGGIQALKQIPGEELETFAKTIPIVSNAMKALNTAIEQVTKLVDYSAATSGRTGTSLGSVTTDEEQDAIIMNDGIVKFHPSDKFMQVNDSTMIAGTNVDGNRKLARAITGGADTNKMISAIRSALQGMSIHVHVDPMKIQNEIKFNTRGIN